MAEPPRITVLAGVNGAGKSSVAGEQLRQSGGEYFNPDEATRKHLDASPSMSPEEANARAWQEGRKRLEEAIRERADFAFETTLGGKTIAALLLTALDAGLEVAMVYVGLENVDMHLKRVRSRVNSGGHDIPTDKIRERFRSSQVNLVNLSSRLSALRVFDNSLEADPKAGQAPEPLEILYSENGELVRHIALDRCPNWAKPVLMTLLRLR